MGYSDHILAFFGSPEAKKQVLGEALDAIVYDANLSIKDGEVPADIPERLKNCLHKIKDSGITLPDITLNNMWATAIQDATLTQAMIDGGCNVDYRQSGTNRTPISLAAEYGNLSAVESLIHAGADVNAVSSWGNTALMEAATTGQTQIVQALINAGADVTAVNKSLDTALLKAINGKGNNPETVALLAQQDYSDLPRDIRSKQEIALNVYQYNHPETKIINNTLTDNAEKGLTSYLRVNSGNALSEAPEQIKTQTPLTLVDKGRDI